MTLSTTSNKTIAQGNGLVTNFSYSFPVPNASELYVYYTAASGTITLLSASQYAVTGIGSPTGGSVTYPLSGSPIQSGTSLTIQRFVTYQQLTDLVNQSGYYPNVVEDALDYLTMQTQQLAEATSRSLQVPFSATAPNLTLPSAAARADQLVGFDDVGNVITYPISASVGAGNLKSEGPFVSGTNFTPGVTTTLVLSQAYGYAANVDVHFDGTYQGPDQYTLSGTSLIFNAPIPIGTTKVYVVGGTTLSIGMPSSGFIGAAQTSAALTGAELLPVQQSGNLFKSTLSAIGTWVVNNLLNSNTGATVIGWIQTATGAVIRTVQDKLTDGVTIFDFMTSAQIADVRAGTASLDLSAPLAAAASWLAASSIFKRKLVFPGGIYAYSVSPNWGMQHASIHADGEVHLRYTGTGNAVIIDAGASPAKISDVYFGTHGGFIVEAPTTAMNGIYVRGLVRGGLKTRCYGAGAGWAGLYMAGAVLVTVDHTTTGDETGGWYLSAQPSFGIFLTQSAAGYQTSYCTFVNSNVQSCNTGIYLDYTLGNDFFGGDSEFNTGSGLVLTANALNNKFDGMDLEANGTTDVSCSGSYNEFRVDTGSNGSTGGFRFGTGSVGNRLIGGQHDQIAIDAGLGNYVGGTVYGRGLSGNLQIVDNGTKSAFGRNWQAQQQKWTYGPESHGAVTVTASPFTYTNNTGMPKLAFVSGGTISAMSYYRGASLLGSFVTNTPPIYLSPGDSLSITYSAAPTLNVATI